MSVGRWEVSGGALLALALLYYLDDSGVTLWVLLAALLHELGHCLAIALMGGRVSRFRLGLAGADLRLSALHSLSPGKMVWAALAGPAVNLLLALGSTWFARRGVSEQLYFFAGLNWGLCCFNLLPVAWLDGGRALAHFFAWLGREDLGNALTDICTKVIALLLLLAGGALLWQTEGRNFTLLLAGLWMVAAYRQKENPTLAI